MMTMLYRVARIASVAAALHGDLPKWEEDPNPSAAVDISPGKEESGPPLFEVPTNDIPKTKGLSVSVISTLPAVLEELNKATTSINKAGKSGRQRYLSYALAHIHMAEQQVMDDIVTTTNESKE